MPRSPHHRRRTRRPARATRTRHRVVAVAYDRVALFELAISAEVFGLPRPELGAPLYDFELCALEPGALRATARVTLSTNRSIRALERADTIIIPGWRDPRETPPARLISALRRAHSRGTRLVSICSGVF